MGLLTTRVERNQIKPGDHIYAYRAAFTYSHHEVALKFQSLIMLLLSHKVLSPFYLFYGLPAKTRNLADIFGLDTIHFLCVEERAPQQPPILPEQLSTLQFIFIKKGIGRSGQASSMIGSPLAALISSSVKVLMPSSIDVATVTAGTYCMSRYATDIGVRTDVIKVPVEDMAVNLDWAGCQDEATEENETSNQYLYTS
ncbi:putative serine/threonine-protein kinase WNK4-like [Hibiscus syriacus]|uniref:Serine/threonine-protein kinase WNK4-like n=1 Tax=Hibiscus syriacus TaxID=106335 RepID=A0A6A3C6I5_HIBSY|nr:putative serine/threonine-protein kinase WNK4-like [Hibiscus syriacus]